MIFKANTHLYAFATFSIFLHSQALLSMDPSQPEKLKAPTCYPKLTREALKRHAQEEESLPNRFNQMNLSGEQGTGQPTIPRPDLRNMHTDDDLPSLFNMDSIRNARRDMPELHDATSSAYEDKQVFYGATADIGPYIQERIDLICSKDYQSPDLPDAGAKALYKRRGLVWAECACRSMLSKNSPASESFEVYDDFEREESPESQPKLKKHTSKKNQQTPLEIPPHMQLYSQSSTYLPLRSQESVEEQLQKEYRENLRREKQRRQQEAIDQQRQERQQRDIQEYIRQQRIQLTAQGIVEESAMREILRQRLQQQGLRQSITPQKQYEPNTHGKIR